MQRSGFTLLELSIVLVIIGLIIGGITVGADMIRSAELNSVVSDLNRYKTAINTYKLKYNALPGDHKNAYAYFDGSGGNMVCGLNGVGSTGCNGNADGFISHTEDPRAWQHMKLADLIGENVYIGYYSWTQSPDVMYPASKISGAVYALTGNYGHIYLRDSRSRSFFRVAANSATNNVQHGIMTPAEAYSLDQKIDDGVPTSGKMFAMNDASVWPPALDCVTINYFNNPPGDYVLSHEGKSCWLVFWF